MVVPRIPLINLEEPFHFILSPFSYPKDGGIEGAIIKGLLQSTDSMIL